MKVLPDSYLRCMSAKDRKSMGKAGQTAAETLAKADVKTEKDLQKAIISLLRLKGFEPIVSRMDKRTSNNIGTPDILFVTLDLLRASIVACAWEVKLPGEQLREEQERMMVRLITPPNFWSYSLIHSVDEAIAELKDMGID